MEGFVLPMVTNVPATTTGRSSSLTSNASLLFPRLVTRTRRRTTGNLNFRRKPSRRRFSVFAAQEDPQFDQWDQMELKFGRLIGEDPKLTMAKIMARKSNPDASYLEIEKSLTGKNGKLIDIKEVPFEGSKNAPQSSTSIDGLNLVRPVPKKGVKFQTDDNKPRISDLRKPVQSNVKSADSPRSSLPNVILRKPSVVNEDDVEDAPSKLRIRRSLSLSMSNQPVKENFSDMTLLRKPEPVVVDSEITNGTDSANGEETKEELYEFTLLTKPEAITTIEEIAKVNEEGPKEELYEFTPTTKPEANVTIEEDEAQSKDVLSTQIAASAESQLSGLGFDDDSASRILNTETADSSVEFSVSSLLKKPMRLEERVEVASTIERAEKVPIVSDPVDAFKLENLPASSEFKESEDADWDRAENLVKTGERGEVELLSSSIKGFVVSFGSLVGFLPYRNLAAKWKFFAFESWLRQKGLDPAKYKQNLGVLGAYDNFSNSNDLINGGLDPQLDKNVSGEISPDMKLEDLLRIYDQEKLKFLSSFVSQKVKVNVVVADRKFRKLLFSVKPKEKEELVEKKRSLMAKLQIGDVVRCCIKKITYFGIFVEVEGVPALIHQTEVSWDATLDPTAFFKIGQVVEAKVHQLDFAMERIFLSLKEITPDPLIEALESVVGDSNSLDGNLQVAQVETEWVEVDSLIKELEQIKGVESVTKGRFFLSPGLAPTFQVYMASMFENQYKLLARAGNQVQELIVESSLDKEKIKSVILTCTNRVE